MEIINGVFGLLGTVVTLFIGKGIFSAYKRRKARREELDAMDAKIAALYETIQKMREESNTELARITNKYETQLANERKLRHDADLKAQRRIRELEKRVLELQLNSHHNE